MNFGIVLYIQSFLIILVGLFQLFPLAFAYYYNGNDIMAFVYSIGIALSAGVILNLLTKRFRKIEVKIRESFGIVTFGWIIAALFAVIPFLIHAHLLHYPDFGTINNFTDAYFEMMSGFTTTGSTILTDIEKLPKGLLFWRSLSHWLGGMGIILLTVAILPALGVGGMQLYQAEVPGPISDKITPRVSQTAKILWGVYLLFTIVETILLLIGGMDFYDSLCHTFGTLATGGFSTKNLSLGYYHSSYIDYVIIIFMFLAGTSFTLHYKFLRRQFTVYNHDREFLFYLGIVIGGTIIIVLNTLSVKFDGSIADRIRLSLFHVVSILTTTGYGVGLNADNPFHFGIWSSFAQFFMIILMLTGGSAGSTSGGIKTLRVLLAIKFVYNETIKFIYPRHIKLVRIGKEVIPESIILSTLAFIMIHLLITAMATLIMNFLDGGLIDSFTAVVATLNNIGPGLGAVAPDKNFAHFSDAGKWMLSFCMLLGRLELYSVIILFMPATWRKN